MSSDTAVTALVGHMNEIETRRRLLMMRVKEAETRLAHCEDDAAAAAKEGAALAEKEAAATARLAQLHEEQRILSQQLSDGTGHLRKSELEEPFLLGNATEQRKGAAQQLANWGAQTDRLGAVTALWASNTLVAPLLKSLAAADAEARAAAAEEKRLVEAIAAAMVAASRPLSNPSADAKGGCAAQEVAAAAYNASDKADDDNDDAAAADTPDTPRCRAQIASLRRDLTLEETAAVRLAQGPQREVDDLRERRAELQLWVDAADAKTAAAKTLMAELQAAMEARMCRSCRA